MISGFDKYFQIAPCFRDEDARSDRLYVEFYQLDMETAFVSEEDVIKVAKKVFTSTFKKFEIKNVSKFEVLMYKESMDLYGIDKPDLRIPLKLINVSKIFKDTTFKPFRNTTIKAIVVKNIADKSNSWFN